MTDRKPITEEDKVHEEWYETAKAMPGNAGSLSVFVDRLMREYQHDYGTICHAVAAAGLAAMRCVSRQPEWGGITGFQAGAIMWELIERWGQFSDGPKRMLSYRDLLYPQRRDKFTEISAETWAWAQAEAKKTLAESNGMCSNVNTHMESVAAGVVPFGLTVAPVPDEGADQ